MCQSSIQENRRPCSPSLVSVYSCSETNREDFQADTSTSEANRRRLASCIFNLGLSSESSIRAPGHLVESPDRLRRKQRCATTGGSQTTSHHHRDGRRHFPRRLHWCTDARKMKKPPLPANFGYVRRAFHAPRLTPQAFWNSASRHSDPSGQAIRKPRCGGARKCHINFR